MILVGDEGTGREKLVIVGEAPAKHEEIQRRPLCGPSGFKLMEWLASAGLNRSDAYLTNVLPYRAPGDKIEAVPKDELRTWVGRLHERIARLANPVVLVPLGNTALRALTGFSTITKRRGSIYGYTDLAGRALKVIGTIHPAALLHRGSKSTDEELDTRQARTWERACRADWARIAGDLQFPELRLPERQLSVRPDLDQLRWFVQQARRPGAVLSLDIETPRSLTFLPQPPTKAGKPRKAKKVVGARRITCIGLALSAGEAMTVPTTLSYWGSAERLDLAWALLRMILHGPAEKVTHNGFFDYFYLADHGVRPVNWIWDTLALHHCLDPADDHGLAYCASIDTRQPFWKDMKDAKEGDDDATAGEISDLDTFWRYCGIDSAITRELVDVYRARLMALGRLGFYRDHYADLLEPLLGLSRHGLQADHSTMDGEQRRLRLDQNRLRSALAGAAGTPLHGKTALSSKKVLDFLYGTLKLPVQYTGRGATKRPTANEVAIRRLMLNKATAERMAGAGTLILADRRVQKLLEFTDPARLDPDGRFRCTYSFMTDTGRLNSRENPKGTGCVTGDVEILTPMGWRSFDTMGHDGLVTAMQWDPETGQTFFGPAHIHVTNFEGSLLGATSWYHRIHYTPDHTIPAAGLGRVAKDTWRISAKLDKPVVGRRADDVAQLATFLLPVSGIYVGGPVEVPMIRLLVMTQADGSIESGAIRISVKKPHKIARFQELVRAAGITYREHTAPVGFRRFGIAKRDAKPIVDLIGPRKRYGSWLLGLSLATLWAFLDETRWWDASRRDRSFIYHTVVEDNARWVATVAHLCGHSASLRVNPDNNRGYGHGMNKPIWSVNIRPRAYVQVARKHWTSRPHTGRVFCLRTLTGYFLARSNGHIIVTGNSNTQNIDHEVRHMFVPDTWEEAPNG